MARLQKLLAIKHLTTYFTHFHDNQHHRNVRLVALKIFNYSYESNESMTIQCSTKVCSFGKQVVEKVETEYPRLEGGRYLYKISSSPMCEYMINFILKLKSLPEKYMMNSVLENFTILQVIKNRDTQETLLCIAYVYEVSTSEHGAQHHIYRLVKD